LDIKGDPIVMFRGSSYHKIDSKGRIIVPTRFQMILKGTLNSGVMLSCLDGGLVAYPFDQWKKIEEKILALAEVSHGLRRFRRVFVGGACECVLDAQNRILVPQTLRDYAKLEKDIVLVGVLDHFEVWSEDIWKKEAQKLEEEDMMREEVKNEIAKLGL
jgi:MraZ protein